MPFKDGRQAFFDGLFRGLKRMLMAEKDVAAGAKDKNKLRVLHAAQMRTPAVGVARQMLEEQRVAELQGIPWAARLFVPEGCGLNEVCVESQVSSSNKVSFKKSFFAWLGNASRHYDVILLRHSLYSPDEVRFLSEATKPVCLVHHTLEVSELASSRGGVGKLLALGEKYFGRMAIRRAAGIVAVTKEIGEYEQRRAGLSAPFYLYPNGLVVDKTLGLRDERSGDVPELIFVASHFAPWHGLDLLLGAAARSSEDFRVHLVGSLSEEQRIAVYKDSRFIEHGLMKPELISDIAARCWVGVGTLALHRNNMFEACPLKVREYLASGLPVFASYADIFPDAFPFFRKGGVSMDEVLSYCRHVRQFSRADVAKAAYPFIDKGGLIANLYGMICNDFDVNSNC